MFRIFVTENPGTFGIPNRILLTIRSGLFKTDKTGTVPGKARRMGSLHSLKITDATPIRIKTTRNRERLQDEICALLGYYASLSGSSVPTFRDILSAPSLSVKKYKKKAFFLDFLAVEDWTDSLFRKLSSWTYWPLKMGPIGCPETSVKNYHSPLRNTPEERRSHVHRGGSLKSHRRLQDVSTLWTLPVVTYAFTGRHYDSGQWYDGTPVSGGTSVQQPGGV
jgi:hypothetical protein